jgi:hypothetical protein
LRLFLADPLHRERHEYALDGLYEKALLPVQDKNPIICPARRID